MRAPVFVCGMGRSGTTWVCRTLGQSPELVYVGEAWLLWRLQELTDWFREVSEEWGGHTVWKKGEIGRPQFVEHVARFYGGLLTEAAGGQRFIEKTTNWNALHLRFLMELFPEAYYLLVFRDGRNQVASLEAKNLAAGKPFDFEGSCRNWAKAMSVLGEVTGETRSENRRLVRYEDLLSDFDAEFQDICRFLQIEPFAPVQTVPNSSFPGEPETDDFRRRWDSWPRDRREVFARCAGEQLASWGYEEAGDW